MTDLVEIVMEDGERRIVDGMRAAALISSGRARPTGFDPEPESDEPEPEQKPAQRKKARK